MKSMTGFAREAGTLDGRDWVWEVKSVNGRGLDLRFRWPPGYDSLESRLREVARKTLHRGSINASLNIETASTDDLVSINEDALQALLSRIDQLRPRIGDAPIDPVSLLTVRGVMEAKGTETHLTERFADALTASFKSAIGALVENRTGEGASLRDTLTGQIAAIEALLEKAIVHPSRSSENIFNKLKQQVAQLLQTSEKFDEARLHQEAAILAVKADIQEELDRLRTHINSARSLVATDDQPVGRKLDFLTQEFNREANTLCSKSSHQEMTAIGLDMKSVIDQMREQVQNIE